MEQGAVDPDWFDPFFQDAPESRAVLDLLRRMGPRFGSLDDEITDAQWTAFRELAAKGAVEGILRLSFTDLNGTPKTERYCVFGNYVGAMPGGATIRHYAPIDLHLEQARLTGLGERWAGYLRGEADAPAKVRGFVLSLMWQATQEPGRVEITLAREKSSGGQLVGPLKRVDEYDWFTVDMLGGQVASAIQDEPQHSGALETLRAKIRAAAARRQSSLVTAENFKLANAIRAWLVSERSMDAEAVGRLPIRVVVEMLDAGVQPSAGGPGAHQTVYGNLYQQFGHGHMNLPNHQHNVNVQGTQNVAGGNINTGDQQTAGHDLSVETPKSTWEKVCGWIKLAWSFIAGKFGVKS